MIYEKLTKTDACDVVKRFLVNKLNEQNISNDAFLVLVYSVLGYSAMEKGASIEHNAVEEELDWEKACVELKALEFIEYDKDYRVTLKPNIIEDIKKKIKEQ